VPRVLSDEKFIQAWNEAKCSPVKVAEITGLSQRAIYSRRSALTKRGVMLQSIPSTPTAAASSKNFAWGSNQTHFVRRRGYKVKDGVVVVFSDAHWLPDHHPRGLDALLQVIEELKPDLIVANGDLLDGGTISRWDPTRGHHKRYSLREELDILKENCDAIRGAAGKAQLSYTLGNHCARLSRYIAVHAEQALDLPYTRLEDWLGPAWPISWTVEVNPETVGMTVIRHRNQSGMLHLQAMRAGCHYVHGHLHRLGSHRHPTFNGIRYSVDTGSLADPESDAFDYAEGAPNHAQGFAVLTYKNWNLMPPDLCEIVGETAWFRGKEL